MPPICSVVTLVLSLLPVLDSNTSKWAEGCMRARLPRLRLPKLSNFISTTSRSFYSFHHKS